ncbi:hypothetical protein [Microbispora sp. NBC_01389]|uniref:hypothetical protein n=1 Tax=Microbispora sp. NBC_01389 TaxID=2903584 RepID=UPI00386E6CE9
MGILTSPGGRAAGASARAGSVPVDLDTHGLRKEHRICPDCVRELFDPRGRRHLYPLVRCRECGPPIGEPRVRPRALCEDCRRGPSPRRRGRLRRRGLTGRHRGRTAGRTRRPLPCPHPRHRPPSDVRVPWLAAKAESRPTTRLAWPEPRSSNGV